MFQRYLRYSHRSIKFAPFVMAVAAALLLGALTANHAWAHERIEVGPYVLVLSWENEPVIVGERNALVVEITQDGAPVENVEGTIDLVVLYGGRSFIGQLEPTDLPGVYKSEIFPTMRGQYEVQLTGQIESESLDLLLEPEEVKPGDVLQFPEVQPAIIDLQSRIDDLEASLATANTIAIAGAAVGVLGLLVAAFAIFRQGKSS